MAWEVRVQASLFGTHDSRWQVITLPDAALRRRRLLSVGDALGAMDDVLAEVEPAEERIRMFGREVRVPRLVAWVGDPGSAYVYSGVLHPPSPWTPAVSTLRERVQRAVGAPFDSVLINLYRDGRDAMGWHADDEPELGPAPLIASLSLGVTRAFRLRHRTRRDLAPVTLELAGGELLVMEGPTQRCWLHEVPRRLRVTEPRLNLTFRQLRCRGA